MWRARQAHMNHTFVQALDSATHPHCARREQIYCYLSSRLYALTSSTQCRPYFFLGICCDTHGDSIEFLRIKILDSRKFFSKLNIPSQVNLVIRLGLAVNKLYSITSHIAYLRMTWAKQYQGGLGIIMAVVMYRLFINNFKAVASLRKYM